MGHSLDFSQIAQWLPSLFEGLQQTVFLTFAGMAVALVVGLAIALARLDPRKWYLTLPARIFVEVIRGTPLLLQLFYIFYVLPTFGIRLDRTFAAILVSYPWRLIGTTSSAPASTPCPRASGRPRTRSGCQDR